MITKKTKNIQINETSVSNALFLVPSKKNFSCFFLTFLTDTKNWGLVLLRQIFDPIKKITICK
jgi:hypothetical protein